MISSNIFQFDSDYLLSALDFRHVKNNQGGDMMAPLGPYINPRWQPFSKWLPLISMLNLDMCAISPNFHGDHLHWHFYLGYGIRIHGNNISLWKKQDGCQIGYLSRTLDKPRRLPISLPDLFNYTL